MLKKWFLLSIAATVFAATLQAQSGKSLELDGVSRYMKISNHADFNIATSESFTVSAWLFCFE